MTAEIFTPSKEQLPDNFRQVSEGGGDAIYSQLYHYASGEVTVYGATSRYTITVPTELQTPDITAFVNGFGAFKKTMRGIRNETSSQGSAALSMSPIRRSDRGFRQDLGDATRLHTDTIAAIFDDLPNNRQLRDIPNGDRLSFGKINLAPHSYGGDSAIKYGIEHPENIANIVLIKSVGLENPGPMRFIPRLPRFFREELAPFIKHAGGDFSAGDGRQALAHFLGDPFQTIGEMRACMNADNRHHLPELRARKIGLAILTGANDNLVPAAPIEKVAMHLVDHYEKLDTNHLGPQNQPQKLAEAVIRAIRTLENQKATKNAKKPYAKLRSIEK